MGRDDKMYKQTDLREFYLEARELKEKALELYKKSDEFPAVNRNCKRILASVEMLMINLEGAD